MAGIGTILGGWSVGQILSELKERGKSTITSNLSFRSKCKDLGIVLPLEDKAKILYLETLIQLANTHEEYNEWISLLDLQSVFKAFVDSRQNFNDEIFIRELESQLHINLNTQNLKKYNTIPRNLLDELFFIYGDLITKTETPVQNKASQERTEILNEVVKLKGIPTNTVSKINTDQLIQQFKSASYILEDSPNTFNNLEGSHIERDETKTLLEWIQQPLEKEKKPIALLVGNAGAGKTTILRDLYEELNKDNTPILGIKADRYCVESLKDLANKLDIDEQILNSFQAILNEKERLVLLIDQIDALSQSLSARRDYLETINRLVRNASNLDGIRIIISIRTFDLAYDDDFKFYNNQKEIKVKGLTKPQIEEVLKKIDFPINQLNDILLELFKTPLHLNVFCKVYGENKFFQDIKTLNDLYGKLWQEKIVNIKEEAKTDKNRCKKLLFKLAKDMNNGQWITLNSSKYNEDFKNELVYLQSAGLINTSNNEIQFFHQTFYDFCFAKRFVEKKKPLTKFILKKNQTLFVRSAIKMILDFQRTEDHDSYIENYQEIISSDKYRFHIKLLLINLLGFINDPTKNEKKLVSEIVLKKQETYYVFLESALSSGWFKYLQEETSVFTDIFNINGGYESLETTLTDQKIEITDFWYQFFRKYIYEHSISILKVLKGQPESKDKDTLIVNCLFILGKWDIPEAFTLFERYRSKNLIDEYLFCNIIADICKYDFNWAIDKYSEVIKQKIIEANDKNILSSENNINWQLESYYRFPNLTRDDENLIEKMREINTQEFFKFGVDLCIKYITTQKKEYYTRSYPAYGCISDYYFCDFYFDEIDGSHSDENVLFSEIAKAVKTLAKEGNTTFTDFVVKYIDSKYISILKLLVYGFIENPSLYAKDIVSLIRNLDNKNGFVVDHHFYLYIRELIKSSFEYLSHEQKQFVVNFIGSFELNYKKKIVRESDTKYKRRCFINFEKEKYRFIKVIDSDELNQFPILLKTLQELERKYPIIPKENRGGPTYYSVCAPVSFESCERFTFEDWKRSFARYSSNEDSDWEKGLGGLNDHARQFSKVVSENPQKFIYFIEKLIDENQVDHEYLLQAMGGLKDGDCEHATFESLFHKLRSLKLNSYHLESVVRLIDYFIQKRHINIEILNFLIDTALDTREVVTHRNGEDIISNGLGSVRGAAVSRLTQIYYEARYKNEIFETLNKIAIEGNEVLTATMLRTISTLRNLDKESTLNTFLLATNNLTLDIAKNALHCLNSLCYDSFKGVSKFVEEAMEFNDVIPELSKIVGFAWLTNRKGAGKLLIKILEKDEKARAMMVFIAEKNMWNSDEIISKRSKELFIRYLKTDEKKVVSKYSSAFIRFEKEYFADLLPLMEKYSKSKVAIMNSISFIEYISGCTKRYPCECIDLVSGFEKYEFERGTFHRESPISVVVGAINSLNQITAKSKKDEEYIEKGISLFDLMLKDSRLRNFAESALQEIN